SAAIIHIRFSRVASRFINPVSLSSIYVLHSLATITKPRKTLSVFAFTCRRLSFRHLFVATSLTLPDRVGAARIRSILIDCAIGRDYLAAATGTDAATRGPLFDVDT